MKLVFDLDRYWKPSLFILGLSAFILYVEPYGSFNLIIFFMSGLAFCSIYKHMASRKMIPQITMPESDYPNGLINTKQIPADEQKAGILSKVKPKKQAKKNPKQKPVDVKDSGSPA